MRTLILLIAFFSSWQLSHAQNAYDSIQIKDSLTIQAERFGNAFIQLDTANFIKYCNDFVIEKYFLGAKNVGKGFKSGKEYSDKIGAKNVSIEIQKVSQIAEVLGEQYAFIEIKMLSTIRQDTIITETYYLGLSQNVGLSWKFIQGEIIEATEITEFFPNYDHKIPMPPKRKQVFLKKNK